MSKIRVYELSKQININSKDIIEKLKEMGVEVSSHMSAIEDKDAKAIENFFVKPAPKKEEKPVKKEQPVKKEPYHVESDKSAESNENEDKNDTLDKLPCSRLPDEHEDSIEKERYEYDIQSIPDEVPDAAEEERALIKAVKELAYKFKYLADERCVGRHLQVLLPYAYLVYYNISKKNQIGKCKVNLTLGSLRRSL